VRELFERAQNQKPSILFFDEFDSLVPRRGSGQTVVTDRIVNQFLCYLDGVEGRDGVFVMAATSRPDLVDVALLRPGRIDKSVLCGFPDNEERVEIIQVYLKKFGYSGKAGFDRELAARTDSFTSADIKGLI
jgi:peroxin-1